MADKNIQMAQRNATNDGWDNLYPKTKAANVVAADGTTTFESHLSDYVRQPGYGVDTGSANAYAVTLNPVPINLIDGMGVIVKIANANTGASTLNVNSLGAKTIKNPDGTDLSSGDLTAGGIYSFKYNSTTGNFILVGKGGVKLTGSAGDTQVLSGYTYYNTDPKTKRSGSMANNGAVTITPGTSDHAIAAGYHNGSGKVSGDTNLVAGNIKKNVSLFGVTGTLISKYTIKTGLSTNDLYLNGVDADGNTYYYETGPAYPKAFKCDANGTLVSTKQPTTSNAYMIATNENGYFWLNNGHTAGYHYDWNGTLIKSLTGKSNFGQLTKMNNKYYVYTSESGGLCLVYDANMTFLHNITGTWTYNAYWFTAGDNQVYEATATSSYDTSSIAKLDTTTDAGATVGFPKLAYPLITTSLTV